MGTLTFPPAKLIDLVLQQGLEKQMPSEHGQKCRQESPMLELHLGTDFDVQLHLGTGLPGAGLLILLSLVPGA